MYKKREQNVDLRYLGDRSELWSYDRSEHSQGRQKYVLGKKILPILPKGRKLTPDGGGDKNYTTLQQKHEKMTRNPTSGNTLAGRVNVKNL